MEPILTLAMADEGSHDSSSRKLHPFFGRAPGHTNGDSTTHAAQPPQHHEHEPKRLKTDDHVPNSIIGFGVPQTVRHGANSNAGNLAQPVAQQAQSGFQTAMPDPNLDQLTPHLEDSHMPDAISGSENTAAVIDPALSETCATLTSASERASARDATPNTTGATASATPNATPSTTRGATMRQTPSNPPPTKKVLKFNMKTGTLGSPPKPKPSKRNSKLVCIKYGQNLEDRVRIGDQITQILAGKLRIEEPASKKAKPKVKEKTNKVKVEAMAKTPHPFFAKDKPLKQQAAAEKKQSATFTSAPGSPRRPGGTFRASSGPSFGIKSTGTKVPGAKHPLWPPHGFSHIRGCEELPFTAPAPSLGRLKKKSKGQTVSINYDESVLGRLGKHLDLHNVRRNLPKDDSVFLPPPAELRLPMRHFESGPKLSTRIRRQILSDLSQLSKPIDVDYDDLAREPSKPIHPCVQRHWQSLAKGLSAYDRSTCEGAAWVSKYAPTTAAQVLQPGKEVALLKQWLEMLRVQGVETAGDGSAKSKNDVKKKKRKSKLDGFIVDSEDESGEMNELSDAEDQPTSSKQRSRPSVARSLDLTGKDPSKLANTILISGPHGSGKSAAVYAVAKELGFEVFEINSSTRRSGKDILERVGDMTRNHLVQHRRAEITDELPDETEAEVTSGKQGMMTSFFKPKAEKQKKSHDRARPKPVSEAKNSAKSQKQSLILLEEVDILYDEDKQFWASLQSLMSQSKRPFIMTCNDESLVPMNTLDLHGIFRFLPPPENLAVDACLLIAANEGHALKREAVSTLYRSRDYDLRATITDLHFWCQIGVGDRKGGYDWFYLRWPKGIDVDKDGDVVRVISEDTYQAGMGWLSRDRIITAEDTSAGEQEAAEQTWNFWQRDLADWYDNQNLQHLAASSAHADSDAHRNLKIVAAYSDYYDNLSCADMCSAGVFGLELEERIDPCLPEMPEPVKDDFIIGQTLLEADPIQPHFCSRAGIAFSVSALSYSALKTSVTGHNSDEQGQQSMTRQEQDAASVLKQSFEDKKSRLTRYDVAVAFDPIAVSPKALSSMNLDPSVFDRTMTMIVLDVAPWVRGIVHYEDQLMQDRQRLNELLGEGNKRKRMRTTRSAYSALEGGERRTTRRERYFGDCLSTEAVMYTAGSGWQQAIPTQDPMTERDDTQGSSPVSADATEMTI